MAAGTLLSPTEDETAADEARPIELDHLLRELQAAGLSIGPRERITATRLMIHLAGQPARQAAPGQAPRLWDFRFDLAPVLARSPEERAVFFDVIGNYEAPHRQRAGEALETGELRRKERLKSALVPLLVAVLLAVAMAPWIWPSEETDEQANTQTSAVQGDLKQTIPQKTGAAREVPAPRARREEGPVLQRLRDAAERYEGAPTLAELARELAPGSPGLDAPDYLRRLQQVVQLPAHRPLLVGSRDDPATERKLEFAIAFIETPANAVVLPAAAAPAPPGTMPAADVVAAWLRRAQTLGVAPDATVAAAVAQSRRDFAFPPATRDSAIARALAAAVPDWTPPDAPWRPPPAGAVAAPFWLPWLAAAAVLALFLPWLFAAHRRRKAYLRLRPPGMSPLRTPLFRAQPEPGHDGRLYRRIGGILQRRDRLPGRDLDVAATVEASIRAGGRIVPQLEVRRARPEYLALIERNHRRDQQARRLEDLLRPLRNVVGLEMLGYQGDPEYADPVGGGRAVRIEALSASRPQHRLLVLGSGRAFFDPLSGSLRPAVGKIADWSRRVMLSTVPAADWGWTEHSLVEQARMPIGRATSEGLADIADDLTADNVRRSRLVAPDNDESPGPPLLSGYSARFRSRVAPPAGDIAALTAELRAALDPPAFEWLCALAVYPALEYELTLYLGQKMRLAPSGGDGPLYSEARLAALTALPWLRDGVMPDWLRRALIAELPPRRQEEVRRLILALLGEAGPAAASPGPSTGRDDGSYPPPDQLMDDEVMLDFLARGGVEDFEVPVSAPADSPHPKRSLLDAIGATERVLLLLAVAYAAAALWVTASPKLGPPPPGAWVAPVLLLILALLVPVAVSLPQRLAIGWPRRSRSLLLAAFALLALIGLGTILLDSPGNGQGGKSLQAPDLGDPVTARSGDLFAYTDGARRRIFVVRQGAILFASAAPAGQRVLTLAVHADVSTASAPLIWLAVATEQGAVYRKEGSAGGASGSWQTLIADRDRNFVATRLATGPDGQTAIAWTEKGVTILTLLPGPRQGPAATQSAGSTLLLDAPVTALAYVGEDDFVWSLADGRIEASAVNGDPALRESPREPRLPAGARLIVPLPQDSDRVRRFIAMADDGSRLRGQLTPLGLQLLQLPRLPALARGPAIPWQVQPVQPVQPAPPAPQLPLRQAPRQTGPTPIVATPPPQSQLAAREIELLEQPAVVETGLAQLARDAQNGRPVRIAIIASQAFDFPQFGGRVRNMTGEGSSTVQGGVPGLIALLAPTAQIDVYPVLNSRGSTPSITLLTAMNRVAGAEKGGYDIVYIPLRMASDSEAYSRGLEELARQALVIVPAGNEARSLTSTTRPASIAVVGALAGQDRATYSNYGPEVDLYAPGTVRIYMESERLGEMTGTTLSSLLAVAAAADIAALSPKPLDGAALKRRLLETTRPVGGRRHLFSPTVAQAPTGAR